MKLAHKHIPQEFLGDLPKGIKYVVRDGQDFLVVEQVFCPGGHSLMVDHVRLHGEPSIQMKVRVGSSEGLIYVDSFWGSHDKLYSFIPEKTDAGSEGSDVMCPACNRSLEARSEKPCRACGSDRVIVLYLPGRRDRIEVCTRIGCPEHRLIAEHLSPQMTDLVSGINYFGL